MLEGKLIPPPLTDMFGDLTELALLMRFELINTTITVMSSWKCRRTPRSIFFRSEYLISLFFAASCRATFTSLFALPCMNVRGMSVSIYVSGQDSGTNQRAVFNGQVHENDSIQKNFKLFTTTSLRNSHNSSS